MPRIVATVPVANRLVTDGLPGALVTTVSLPVRDPACVGVTETLILQVLPLVRVVGQLFVCVKSPVVVIPEIVSVLVQRLVKTRPVAALT